MAIKSFIVFDQIKPFKPIAFFLSEPRDDTGDSKKDKKLDLRFVHNPNFPDIIRARFSEHDVISGMPEIAFVVKSNPKIIKEDTEIFTDVEKSSVTLKELLWVWKFLLQDLAKGNESPISRTGLGNVWNLRDGDIQCKAFFCMNPKTNDVYMHTKHDSVWIPNHQFFLKG